MAFIKLFDGRRAGMTTLRWGWRIGDVGPVASPMSSPEQAARGGLAAGPRPRYGNIEMFVHGDLLQMA